jgi:hypothetical protein
MDNPELDYAVSILEKAGIMVVWPRSKSDEQAADAIEHIAFELISLDDAIRAGAVLTADQKRKLVSIGNRMARRGS